MEIKVFASIKTWNEQKPCFARRVDVEKSILFDTQKIIDVLKMLFGKDCVIEFVFV